MLTVSGRMSPRYWLSRKNSQIVSSWRREYPRTMVIRNSRVIVAMRRNQRPQTNAIIDTLIVWTESNGTDMALSFQEADGCAAIW